MLEADDITVLRGGQVAEAGEQVIEEIELEEWELELLEMELEAMELEELENEESDDLLNLEEIELAVILVQPAQSPGVGEGEVNCRGV